MVPVLCMCRLCLNYSEDCNEVQTQTDIYDKIRKYLNIEVRKWHRKIAPNINSFSGIYLICSWLKWSFFFVKFKFVPIDKKQ